MKSPAVFSVAGLLLAAATGFAGTITFDDIVTAGQIQISNGYQGFNWNNFFVIPPLSYSPNSGYAAGLVSSPNDAYNGYGTAATLSSATPFTLTSGYFTAAWNDGLNIIITGYNGATVVDSETIVISATAPTLETFDWSGLTEVLFVSLGGTPDPAYTSSGFQFALDNLTINGSSSTPEPSGYLLVGVGLATLTLLRKSIRC